MGTPPVALRCPCLPACPQLPRAAPHRPRAHLQLQRRLSLSLHALTVVWCTLGSWFGVMAGITSLEGLKKRLQEELEVSGAIELELVDQVRMRVHLIGHL